MTINAILFDIGGVLELTPNPGTGCDLSEAKV